MTSNPKSLRDRGGWSEAPAPGLAGPFAARFVDARTGNATELDIASPRLAKAAAGYPNEIASQGGPITWSAPRSPTFSSSGATISVLPTSAAMPRSYGLSHAEHRPDCQRGHALHRLLR